MLIVHACLLDPVDDPDGRKMHIDASRGQLTPIHDTVPRRPTVARRPMTMKQYPRWPSALDVMAMDATLTVVPPHSYFGDDTGLLPSTLRSQAYKYFYTYMSRYVIRKKLISCRLLVYNRSALFGCRPFRI